MEKLSEQLRCSLENYIKLHLMEDILSLAVPMLYCEDMSVGSFAEDDSVPSEEYVQEKRCVPRAKASTLAEMLRREDAGFTETLLRLIDKTGKKDSEIYKKANLSKQHFSKIRSNPSYRPTKPTAVALAMALELSIGETQDLIGRAGYTLSYSSKFDLIVRYFIENEKYNITELNIALYEFDQPLLGN